MGRPVNRSRSLVIPGPPGRCDSRPRDACGVAGGRPASGFPTLRPAVALSAVARMLGAGPPQDGGVQHRGEAKGALMDIAPRFFCRPPTRFYLVGSAMARGGRGSE